MGPVAIPKARACAPLVLLMGLAAAGPVVAGSEGRGRAETWYAGSHCGGTEAGAKVLASGGDYRAFRERRSLQATPGFPWDGRWLLALSMGRQPTAGYRLALAEARIGYISGDEARIRVRWQEPDPEGVRAQVVTRPCLLVALPSLGVARLRVRIVSRKEGPAAWTVHPAGAP